MCDDLPCPPGCTACSNVYEAMQERREEQEAGREIAQEWHNYRERFL